ncbi:MAG: DUF58 domain-containing protein [Anaerolineae bacterium]
MNWLRAVQRYLLQRGERLWRINLPDGEARLELRQRLWLIAPLVLIALYIVWPQPWVLTGAVTVISLVLFNYAWARTLARTVTASRTLRYTAVQVGDELEEVVQLSSRSALPAIFAEIDDLSNAPGYSISSVQAVPRSGTVQWRVTTMCTQRGVFTLGPWELITGDPFGLFRVHRRYTNSSEILVYPPLAALSPDLLPQQRQVGDLRRLRHAVHAETIDVATTRPYASGDPLRRVHWRTSARHNDLFVKMFEPEASSSVWLILDTDAAVQAGVGAESTLEKMIILTASLAAQLLADRLAVGVLLTDTAASVLPQAGEPHVWSILRALALVQPQSDRPFERTLLEARQVITARDAVVALTPSLNPTWVRALSVLNGGRFNAGTEVVLIDPASFGGATGASDMAALLRQQGLVAHVVRNEDIQPITGTYGTLRRWEFQTLGTGRIVVRQTPREAPAHA